MLDAPPLRAAPDDNMPRVYRRSAGVESWFVRANHPRRPLALWVKTTSFVPRRGRPQVESWFILFDGERGSTWAARETQSWPREQARWSGERLQVGPSHMSVSSELGEADGTIRQARGERASWSLHWRAEDSEIGRPLCLLPTRRLLEAPFPKNKLLTPGPVLRFDGEVEVAGRRLDLRGWIGSQGHNWGAAHAREYAWAQVAFCDDDGQPRVFAEGYSGRIPLGPWSSPLLSGLVVRRGDREYRFDRIVDLWNQRTRLDDMCWRAHFRGVAGEASLVVEADHAQVVCLGYRNPDATTAYCLNSKLARAHLRVNPVLEDAFDVETEHCAALEMLSPDPHPRHREVI